MLKIYLARSMTGRPKKEVYDEAKKERDFLRKAGFAALCPIEYEGLKKEKGIINASRSEMDSYWYRDKQAIRESHLVFNMTPHLRSDGAAHEVGYKRYHLQGPVVHVYPTGMLPSDGAVSYLEDDYVCDSIEEAIEYTLRVHGTFWLRTKWRFNRLNRCILKSMWYQLKEWFK